MGTTLNREAYEKLISEDIERLFKDMSHCPERDHIREVLNWSINQIYEPKDLDLKNFTAKTARDIIENTLEKKILNDILRKIKTTTYKGERKLHVYNSLPENVLNELRQRGFVITHHPGIAVQKDDLYYTINW